MLYTIHDFRNRCANQRCHAMPNLSADELWKYQESLVSLMAAMGLGRDYQTELSAVRRVSRQLASSYTIEIVEIPSA